MLEGFSDLNPQTFNNSNITNTDFALNNKQRKKLIRTWLRPKNISFQSCGDALMNIYQSIMTN